MELCLPKVNDVEVHSSPDSPVCLNKYLLEQSVRVTAGQSATSVSYYLPSSLLKAVSGYFRACLNGNFAESVANEVHLKDAHPVPFQHFVSWLYDNDDLVLLKGGALMRLWLFADSILCEGLQNRAIDLLRSRHEILFRSAKYDFGSKIADILFLLSDMTTEQSPLRHYYLSKISYEMAKGKISLGDIFTHKAWESAPAEICKELLIYYETQVQLESEGAANDPALEKGCYFHVHESSSSKGCKEDSGSSTVE